jgi:hypothetical protein
VTAAFPTDEREDYWQPQPAEAISPQHDAFSAGSQQAASAADEQQLAALPSTCSRSSSDAEDATDSAMTTVPT